MNVSYPHFLSLFTCEMFRFRFIINSMSLMKNMHSYAKSFNIKWETLLDYYHLPPLPADDPSIKGMQDTVDGTYTVPHHYPYTYETRVIGGEDYYTVSCQSATDPESSYTFCLVPWKKDDHLLASYSSFTAVEARELLDHLQRIVNASDHGDETVNSQLHAFLRRFMRWVNDNGGTGEQTD